MKLGPFGIIRGLWKAAWTLGPVGTGRSPAVQILDGFSGSRSTRGPVGIDAECNATVVRSAFGPLGGWKRTGEVRAGSIFTCCGFIVDGLRALAGAIGALDGTALGPLGGWNGAGEILAGSGLVAGVFTATSRSAIGVAAADTDGGGP
jgi:hypothetical protein